MELSASPRRFAIFLQLPGLPTSFNWLGSDLGECAPFSLQAPMLRCLSHVLLKMLGKLKSGMKSKNVGDLLHRTRRVCQEFLSFLQTDSAVILFRAEADAFGEGLAKVRVADAEFRSDRRQTETLLTTKGDQRMRTLDQLIDATIEARAALKKTDHRQQMNSHGRKKVLICQRAAGGKCVAPFEAPQQIRLESSIKDRLAWLNDSRPNGFIEYGSLTLDPMLGPSGSNIGSIAVPHPRKEKKHRARLDRLRFPRVLTFKDPGAFGDKDDLIPLENSTVRPFKMVIGGMPGRRILGIRSYARKAD